MSVPGVQLGVPQGVPTTTNPANINANQLQQIMAQLQPKAQAVASFARNHQLLKNRKGLLNNKDEVEFFRYKRLIRCLQSEDYKKHQANPQSNLPPFNTEKSVKDFVMILLQFKFIYPGSKLHYKEIKQTNKNWTPNKTKPTLIKASVASPNFGDDDYFIWDFNKPSPYTFIYGMLLLAAVFTVILFPLWPPFMKRGVYWLSMLLMCLIGGIFGIAIIRLFIYVGSLIVGKPFWLFPNLFADVGFFESFVPLYEWEKPKKSKSKSKSKVSSNTTEKATVTSSSGVQLKQVE